MSRESRRRRREAASLESQYRSRRRQNFKLAVAFLVFLAVGFAAWWGWSRSGSRQPESALALSRSPQSYLELCSLAPNEIAECDIALMNLLCAEGLRGAESLNVAECLRLLDGIAQGVKAETDRHFYKFHTNPAEFNHSQGYYRIMMLVSVLQQDLGVRYSPERLRMSWEPLEESHRFFESAADVFIHGLTREGGTGTCSSMPVFYVAIGRRLGYPLSLVKAKGHLFARWDEGNRSFNIEGTSLGFLSEPDDYYRTFPASFTPEEAEAEGYLKSLTPTQELAVFLTIRGHCLRGAGDFKGALGAFAQAFYRDPDSLGCQLLHSRAEREAAAAGVLPRINVLALEIRDLELPGGPMQAIFAEQQARLMARLHAGASVEDVEAGLAALRAEARQRQWPVPWGPSEVPNPAIGPPQHLPLQAPGVGLQPHPR